MGLYSHFVAQSLVMSLSMRVHACHGLLVLVDEVKNWCGRFHQILFYIRTAEKKRARPRDRTIWRPKSPPFLFPPICAPHRGIIRRHKWSYRLKASRVARAHRRKVLQLDRGQGSVEVNDGW